MDDLIAFLRARLDEDAVVARATRPGPVWFADGGTVYAGWRAAEPVADCGESAEHIARHDPARVLDRVEATLRLVDRLERACARQFPEAMETITATAALGLLALPYADHPDYRDEWRP
ncbi:DUF6221 family protein [Streptomyces sp. NPDC006339]|uniref:DUF6221 family protein n=1 Tax=Streptomyces sp. NPDC006339 TaxID=3156755 RepID=UPI0033B078DC